MMTFNPSPASETNAAGLFGPFAFFGVEVASAFDSFSGIDASFYPDLFLGNANPAKDLQ
jgi:hypothetical protein